MAVFYTGHKGAYGTGGSSFSPAYEKPGTISIHQVTKSWKEDASTTWESHGSSSSNAPLDTNVFLDTTTRWLEYDVTGSIKKAVQSPASFFGFSMQATCPFIETGSGNGGIWTYYASCSNSNSKRRPKLIIEYTNQTDIKGMSRYTLSQRGDFYVTLYSVSGRKITSFKAQSVKEIQRKTFKRTSGVVIVQVQVKQNSQISSPIIYRTTSLIPGR